MILFQSYAYGLLRITFLDLRDGFSLSQCSLNEFRRKMYEKDLLNDAWIIDFSQITLGTVDNRFASKVRKYVVIIAQLKLSLVFNIILNVDHYLKKDLLNRD